MFHKETRNTESVKRMREITVYPERKDEYGTQYAEDSKAWCDECGDYLDRPLYYKGKDYCRNCLARVAEIKWYEEKEYICEGCGKKIVDVYDTDDGYYCFDCLVWHCER